MLGETGVKFIPGGAAAASADDAVPAGLSPVQAARADPVPLASTVTPTALSIERRVIARRATSPKYSLSLVLGA